MNWHLCLCSIFQACQFHPTWFCSIAQNLKSGNWLYLYCIWWLCQLPVYLLCYSLYIICLVFQCQACLARACQFPRATKKLHITVFVIVFYFYFTYAQLCYIFLFYVFNWIVFISCCHQLFFCCPRKYFLYMCKGSITVFVYFIWYYYSNLVWWCF